MKSWEEIERNPKFVELVQARKSLGWTLSIVTLIVYFGFILLIAFDPKLLGAKIGSGVMTIGMPIGMPIGLIVIVVTFLLVGVYVRKANATYDELTRQIVEESK